MSGLALWAVLLVFIIDGALFLVLIVLKTVNRGRKQRRAVRRDGYLELLSRLMVGVEDKDSIPSHAAEDEAFLDAVIDLRNTITGPELKRLSAIAKDLDLVARQERILKRPLFRVRRLGAAVSLAELGDETSVPILLQHLGDRDDEIRVQAARGLARIGYTPAIDRIVDRLEVENDWVRARFGDSLIAFGVNATPQLMAYVAVNHAEGNLNAVIQAIHSLKMIGDYTVGPRLAQVLDTAVRPEVAIASASALGAVGGSFAVASLLDALASSDWRIRAQAATSLGEVGDESVEDDLAASLTDQSWWVRRNAAMALARLPGAIPQLYRALTSLDPFARDAAAEVLEGTGELAKARLNHERGTATRDEVRLLKHMRGVAVVQG